MPLEHPLLLQRDAASGQRLTLAVLAVKLLKLRPPPLAGVLRIPEASRILVLADFLKVVILHLTALLLVLFLAAHIRFLSLGCLWLNYINLPCYQCSKLHSYTPSPQSRPAENMGHRGLPLSLPSPIRHPCEPHHRAFCAALAISVTLPPLSLPSHHPGMKRPSRGIEPPRGSFPSLYRVISRASP